MEKALYVLFPFLKLPFGLKDVKRFVTSKNSCTFALSKDKEHYSTNKTLDNYGK